MTVRDDGLPNPQPIIDLINGFRRSKVLFTIVSLRVPEVMAARQNNSTLEQVATDVGAHLGYQPSLVSVALAPGPLGGHHGWGSSMGPHARWGQPLHALPEPLAHPQQAQ